MVDGNGVELVELGKRSVVVPSVGEADVGPSVGGFVGATVVGGFVGATVVGGFVGAFVVSSSWQSPSKQTNPFPQAVPCAATYLKQELLPALAHPNLRQTSAVFLLSEQNRAPSPLRSSHCSSSVYS